jgi:Rad52/22 family double-strand break repair protein
MAFSAKQLRALNRNPNHRHIRTREANGRELTYLEGWYAISEANRIFGFDGWNRETIESLDRLSRYEHVLWRQARQIVFTLESLRYRRRQPRRSTFPFC